MVPIITSDIHHEYSSSKNTAHVLDELLHVYLSACIALKLVRVCVRRVLHQRLEPLNAGLIERYG